MMFSGERKFIERERERERGERKDLESVVKCLQKVWQDWQVMYKALELKELYGPAR